MASGPTWNGQRGFWYVQFWQGKWRKKKVADGPRGWQPGDPAPALSKAPPEAFAARAHYDRVERAAREREAAGAPASLAAFLAEHVDGYVKESTRRSVRETADQFLAFCREHGVAEVDQVVRPFCKKWINHLARTYAVNTVERKKAQVAAAWGLRKKAGEIAANPWESIKAKGRPSTKGRGAWTPAQFAALLDGKRELGPGERPSKPIRPWLRDLLVFGVNTGLRIEALTRLEWRDVVEPETPDQKLGFIVVRPELDKARAGYKVPLSRLAREIVDRRLGDPGRDPAYIITGSRGKRIANRSVSGTAIKRRAAHVGLPPPTSPNHHLRRTFGRWAVMGHLTGRPVPLYIVSRWLGHSNVRTTLIYLDMEEEDSTRFMVPD